MHSRACMHADTRSHTDARAQCACSHMDTDTRTHACMQAHTRMQTCTQNTHMETPTRTLTHTHACRLTLKCTQNTHMETHTRSHTCMHADSHSHANMHTHAPRLTFIPYWQLTHTHTRIPTHSQEPTCTLTHTCTQAYSRCACTHTPSVSYRLTHMFTYLYTQNISARQSHTSTQTLAHTDTHHSYPTLLTPPVCSLGQGPEALRDSVPAETRALPSLPG